MSTTDTSTTTSKVRRHYERVPYPERDPTNEDGRLVFTATDDLLVVNHYCYRGRRDYRERFRVLVAGGGTGDATIFLAEQLRSTPGEVVYLDLSQASADIARLRVQRRGLQDKVTWIRGSLLELPGLELEPFDFINCCGVLHHLEDPLAGLKALRAVLKDDGAMGLMVYGRYGRVGIYQMQELMRLVNHGESDWQAQLDNTKRMVAAAPETNWLKKGKDPMVELEGVSDSEYFDKFLHPQDRAFSVLELYELLGGAGLHLVEFCPPFRAHYDPAFGLRDPRLRERIDKLPRPKQQAAMELFWGLISKHMFWASPRADTTVDLDDQDNVPRFSLRAQTVELQDRVCRTKGDTFSEKYDLGSGVTIGVTIDLNDVTRRMFPLINGERSIGEIARSIFANCTPSKSANEVWLACHKALTTLRTCDLVVFGHKSVLGPKDAPTFA